MTTRDYADLRRQLAELAIELRDAKAELEAAEAPLVLDALSRGKNDAERKALATTALAANGTIQFLRRKLAGLEAQKERHQAELDILNEYRRDERWMIRARLVEALEAQRLDTDAERAFDSAADEAAIKVAECANCRAVRACQDDGENYICVNQDACALRQQAQQADATKPATFPTFNLKTGRSTAVTMDDF